MKRLALVATTLLANGLPAMASNEFEIVSNINTHGEIRARYEHADSKIGADATRDAANAYTTRIKLGVGGDLFEVKNLSFYLEGTSVNNFGYVNYNGGGTGINANTKYDLIKDPQQARITQAYLNYTIDKTSLRAGRQVINLDNQRFIGSVNWRQMFQTFDAITVTNNTFKHLRLLGAYLYGRNGVGEQQAASQTNSIVLHGIYKADPMFVITAYDYMFSSYSDTYGTALTGKIDAGIAIINYRAEYARQTDPSLQTHNQLGATAVVGKNGKPKADAQYYNLNLGANISSFLVGADYEVLGKAQNNAATGFYTPFATLHKFNGWADVFLPSKNNAGLEDASAHLGYTNKTFGKIVAIYHKFNSQNDIGGSTNLGSELDIVYKNKIPGVKNLIGLASGAFYKGGNATGYNADKTVLWLQLDYKFAMK